VGFKGVFSLRFNIYSYLLLLGEFKLGVSPRLNTCSYLLVLSFLHKVRGLEKSLPHIKDYLLSYWFLPPKVLKEYALLRGFVSWGPGSPKLTIYSLKVRKSGFHSLHLYLLMRPLVIKLYSGQLSLKGTSTTYMGSISPVPPWSRDSPYAHFERILF
jgi:hypothetical protein